MSEVLIYTLSNPISSEIRYVGVTKRTLKKRMRQHIHDAKTGVMTHKSNWIRQLLKEHRRPIIDIIDIVPEYDWAFWEQYWIAQLKSWGFRLVNETMGGEGTLGNKGWKHSEITKSTIRSKNSGINSYNFGKRLTEEWKQKISDSLSGNKNPFYGKKHTNQTLDKLSQPVIQYTLNGDFIKEWPSMKGATKATNIFDISWACKKIHHSAGGYQWRIKTKDYPLKIEQAKPYRKKVAQIDTETNGVIKIWNSITQAQNALGISHISKVCHGYGSHKTSGGYKWKFV